MSHLCAGFSAGLARAGTSARGLSSSARVLLVLVVCLAACNTSPLARRSWVEIQTPHYDIISSLGEARSAAVAQDLESFRSAAEYLLGRRIPTARIRTRVYAFDDRGFNSKFGLRGERGFLLTRLRGDVIVLRGGGGWAGDASVELKLHYARRLLRTAGTLDSPPWYDEGLAQLGSMLVVDGLILHLGLPNDDHIRRLQRSNWVGIDRVLEAGSLEGWSSADRELFDAEAWAIARYLKFGSGASPAQAKERERYLASLRAGDSQARSESKKLGRWFARSVHSHAVAEWSDSLTARLHPPEGKSERRTRRISMPEVLAELGRLSLALGRAEQARKFFWDAASHGPDDAALWSGTGVALSLEGDWPSAQQHFLRALELDAQDPLIRVDHANMLRARAEQTTVPAQRQRLVERAREQYHQSLALSDLIAETHAMLARSYLVDGQHAEDGLVHIDRALALLPASLEARLVRSQILLRSARRPAARADAVAVLTRGRTRRDVAAARTLLEEIEMEMRATRTAR